MLDTPKGARKEALNSTQNLHLQHLTRVQAAAQRQATDAAAVQEAVAARTSDYLKKLGKSE